MTSSSEVGQICPHKRPGALLIWPEQNLDLVYDPETKRVVDTKTGERFGLRQQMRSGGIYSAGITDKDGAPVYGYELKYGKKRVDGERILTVWQVFWAVRGEDLGGSLINVQIPGRERAKNDSIERLAEFLRAVSRGEMLYARKKGMTVDETSDAVVVC